MLKLVTKYTFAGINMPGSAFFGPETKVPTGIQQNFTTRAHIKWYINSNKSGNWAAKDELFFQTS